jgi:hypothetical protein
MRSIAASFGLSLILLASVMQIRPDPARADQPGSNPRTQKDSAELLISGKVVDRETKQPVRWCHIVPGIRSTRPGFTWDAAASVLVMNGRYQFKCPADAVPHVLKADGDEYQIAISKEIPGNASTTSIDFELTKLPAFEAIVLTPDRKPAVGAEVAVVLDNSPLVLHNGDSNVVVGSELSCQTDAFGKFQFRSRRQTFYLAITHPSGYAFFRPALNSKHRSINLDPWTRVEGTLLFDGKPLADTTVHGQHDRAPALDFDPAALFVREPTAETDADGRFVVDHLLSGSGRIGFRIPEMPGSHPQCPVTRCWIATKFPLGQTVRIEFGGPCRNVVGKLRSPPGLKTPLRWSGATISLETEPANGATQNLEFESGAASDGTFRINSVPAGQYKLEVNFMPWDDPHHYLVRHFAVSKPGRTSATQPLDLGVLTLESR